MSIFLKTLVILVAVPDVSVTVILIYISFMTIDVDLLSYVYWKSECLLLWSVCSSLLVIFLCVFYLFVLLIYRGSLPIWGMSPLSIICVVSDFSYSVDLNMLLWKFSNIWWIICGKSIMNLYLSSSSFKNYCSMDNLVSLLPYPFLPKIGLF